MSESVDRPSRSRVRRAARNAKTLHPSSVSIFVDSAIDSNQLVDEIEFQKIADLNESKVALIVKNNHNRKSMAYKVKTTSNKLIRIRPARDLLWPGEEAHVELACLDVDSLLASNLREKNHWIAVAAVFVDDEVEDAVSAWKQFEKSKPPIWKKKLLAKAVVDDDQKNGHGSDRNGLDDVSETLERTKL